MLFLNYILWRNFAVWKHGERVTERHAAKGLRKESNRGRCGSVNYQANRPLHPVVF